jgi:hypothetical protein
MKERTPILKGTYNVEVKHERTKMEVLGMTIDKKTMQGSSTGWPHKQS